MLINKIFKKLGNDYLITFRNINKILIKNELWNKFKITEIFLQRLIINWIKYY